MNVLRKRESKKRPGRRDAYVSSRQMVTGTWESLTSNFNFIVKKAFCLCNDLFFRDKELILGAFKQG